jgi:hypothetical protein
MTDELQRVRLRRHATGVRKDRSCRRCTAAWSLAAHAEAERRAATADAARARESERHAYTVAQDALEQVTAARQELQRLYRREQETA